MAKKRVEKTTMRSLKAKLISGCYVGYFMIDMLISSTSGFSMIYISVLGVLCLIAAIGLWLQRSWGLWLAAFLSSLTFLVGAVTLYAWIGLVGFSSDLHVLTLSTGLLLYSAIAVIVLLYLFANRRLFT